MIPGEVVEVRPRAADPGWADLERVLQPAPGRRRPPCPFAGRCGGCHWQQMDESTQRHWRRHRLLETLHRCGVDPTLVEPELGAPPALGYRCRVRVQVDSRGAVGFHAPGSRQVVDVDRCPLMASELDRAYQALRAVLPAGAARVDLSGVEIIALPGGGRPLARLNPRDRPPLQWRRLARRLIDAAGFGGIDVQGGEPPEGAPLAVGRIEGGGPVAVALGGFVQAHLAAAEAMARWIVAAAGARPGTAITELYAGSGFLGWRLAAAGAEVLSVESAPRAVTAAGRLPRPGRGSWSWRAERAETFLARRPVAEVVVADPPRSGLGAALRPLLAAAPRRLLLVSCSLSGLGRDLPALIEAGYRPGRIVPCDLFPQTRHLETVLVFERSGSG